jgi:collagenase-like PrtC family protease
LIPLLIPTHPVPQVLAPAGGREQFLAALNAGADQVFLGLKAFNARARAENFGVEDLRELVPLAHRYGMQVLVTVNVLIKENEMSALIDMLSALEELEVDAIIVQDQGVGAIVQQYFPTLKMHASTQMAVHNLQGVIKAAALGFRRVVLARELTAKEMKDIRAGVNSDVTQLEAFVHGSLCYSYSGLCLFSGEMDARSGNRGSCSYACREPFKLTSEDGMGFLFSMADLDTSHDLDLLAEAGIDTLKIEGRKKGEEWEGGREGGKEGSNRPVNIHINIAQSLTHPLPPSLPPSLQTPNTSPPPSLSTAAASISYINAPPSVPSPPPKLTKPSPPPPSVPTLSSAKTSPSPSTVAPPPSSSAADITRTSST